MEDRILANRYSLESEIGRGGMGVVYKATDTEVKRTVAVKALPAVMSHNQDLMRRFTSEVQHASKLEHPNIVRVFDVGEDEGTHFYVMQYIDGSDLRSQMKSKGRYSVDETIFIISQVADALDYAHSQGIVHRDIKPENILLDSEGNAHVADFGIAKATEGTRTTRGMLGTPEYMSPEQVRGKSVDGRSDQYSLAVVAYEMLTGKTPFKTEGDDPWAQINMHLNTSVPNPRTTVPDIPTYVADALLQALAKKPEQRFDSCVEFVGALDGEIEAVVPDEQGRMTGRRVAWRTTLTVSITIAIVAAALVVCSFSHRKPHYDTAKVAPVRAAGDAELVDLIAFISEQEGVYRVFADKPGKRGRATIGLPFHLDGIDAGFAGGIDDVRISRDGKTVLLSYWEAHSGDTVDVYVIRPSQGISKKVASGEGLSCGEISPDGNEVVYSDGNVHLLRIPDMTDRTLTASGQAKTPAFTEDGQQIVYVDESHICLMNKDGSGVRQLTNVSGDYLSPVLSKGGDRLAYVQGTDVYLTDRDGQPRALLSGIRQEPDRRTRPYSFSPDGRKLAVITKGESNAPHQLVIIDLVNGSKRTYSRDEIMCGTPSFSLDSGNVAVSLAGTSDRSECALVVSTHSGSVRSVGLGRGASWITYRSSELVAESPRAGSQCVVPDGILGRSPQTKADFDGDGALETAGYGDIESGRSVVWISKPDRILSKDSTLSGFSNRSPDKTELTARDLTGDRVPELILVGTGDYGPTHNIAVYHWNGRELDRVWNSCDHALAPYWALIRGNEAGRPSCIVECYDASYYSDPASMSDMRDLTKSDTYSWNGRKFTKSASKQIEDSCSDITELKDKLGISGDLLWREE